jgi:triacylglycerol lipase
MRLVWILLLCLMPIPAFADCVVLLHGLARSQASFTLMAAVLDRAGYRVVNHGYPSTETTIDTLAGTYLAPAVDACGADRVHFVTHSLGGILVRYWLARHRPPKMGRVVMLAPPNRGSELVDTLGNLEPFQWINGPAGDELGTGAGSVPNRLGPAHFDLGVIAGNRSLNPYYSALIAGADDGKVGVERTKVPGMDDHLTIAATHTFIMNNPLAIAQALEFLRNGRFDHALTESEAIRRLWALRSSPP